MAAEVLHPLRIRGEVERRGVGALARDPADIGIRQVAAADVDVVLVLEAVLQHLELQHADRADDDLLHAAVRLVEDLDGALLRDLGDTLDKLLAFHGVHLRDDGKMLRRKRGDTLEAHAQLRVADRVADGEDAGVEHTDDVAGVGLIDDRALLRHELLRLRKLERLAALHVQVLMVALELARADAHEGDAVAVGLIHVRLNFEHECGKRRLHRVDHAVSRRARQRRHRHVQEVFQKRLDAEIRQRGAEKHRTEPPGAHLVEVEGVARAVEQFNVLGQLFTLARTDQLVEPVNVRELALDGADLVLPAVKLLKREDLAAVAVEHALEIVPAADGPVDRVGADAELIFQLLHELERVAGLAVELVDECEDWDVAHGADLEELARLRLDALGRVDDHDGAVRCHERAVRVLREVLVARGVEDVDAIALVFKLHDRRRDGDAALLFELHPVRDRVARGRLALDRAGELDGPAVQQQLFRERRLAGVRVRDDRKGPAALDFLFQIHSPLLYCPFEYQT